MGPTGHRTVAREAGNDVITHAADPRRPAPRVRAYAAQVVQLPRLLAGRGVAAVLALCAALVSVVVLHLPTFAGGLLPTSLPLLYSNDQMGYLSIVTNVAHGHGAAAEPMTLTGSNHYPSGYYTAVGLIARWTGLAPVTAWNLTSMTIQVLAIGVLGFAIAVLSRRTWAALLGPVPLFSGTFSWLLAGDWKTSINIQGALWGPFGVLFPNNGETAGLCVIVAVLAGGALVWARPVAPRTRLAVTSIGCALLGLTANFQTYSFLSGVYVVAGLGTAYVLSTWRSPRTGLLTITGVLAVMVLGPLTASSIGSLPALLVGLLPAVPAAVLLLRRTGPWCLLPPALLALCAAPMIFGTLQASMSGDAFMSYRTSSNVGLGVVRWTTLWTSLPVLCLAGAFGVHGLRTRRPFLVAAGLGLPLTWILIAINDVWGANAEPYRFWIDGYLFVCVAIGLGLATVWGSPATEATVTGDDLAAVPTTDRTAGSVGMGGEHRDGSARRTAVRLTIATVALAALTFPDFARWTTDPSVREAWDPGAPRAVATAAALDGIAPADGLVVTAPCIDPRTAKILSGAPMASYYLGMAWPERRDAVQVVMDDRGQGRLDPVHLAAADVRWVLTDTMCDDRWADTPGLVRHRAVDYAIPGDARGTLTLWAITPVRT